MTGPGVYTWVASIPGDAKNSAATEKCGNKPETAVIYRPAAAGYKISTGYDIASTKTSALSTYSVPNSLYIPRLKKTAPMSTVGVSGALYKANSMKKGDLMTVTHSGKTYTYKVTSINYYSRDNALPSWVFDTKGAKRLVVVSCANKVKKGAGFHYKDNIVISASPV